MKTLLFFSLFFLSFSGGAFAQNLPKIKNGDPLPANLFVELAKAVNPAVVNIFTTYLPKSRMQGYGAQRGQDPFFDMFEQFMNPDPYGNRRPAQSLGTGFLIREDGLIVTNNHVIDRADVIKVQIDEKNKESFDAKVIGKDPATDLALIKIEAKKKLPILKLGSSSDIQVGEWVAAFGNPFGHGHSMTKGIISAIGREIDELNLAPFIQTDASINPGNSGGPLVDTQGLVIGVNSAIDARAQGIGFAIPIDTVKTIISQLEKSGRVDRGWLGLSLMDISEEHASALEMEKNKGVLAVEVWPGSPAEKAGFQPYDLVVSVDGVKVTTSSELTRTVKNTPIGKKIAVNIVRNSKPKTLSVIVGAPRDATSEQPVRNHQSSGARGLKAPFNLGFAVANYSPAIAQEFGLPKSMQRNPVVVEVARGSEAANSGLIAGDIILDVNRGRTEKATDVVKNLRSNTVNVLRVLKRDRVVLISLRAN